MSWNAGLTKLQKLLADLYPDIQRANEVVKKANLPSRRIQFNTAAESNWFNILEEADRRRQVSDIIDIACDDFPNLCNDLTCAHEEYLSQILSPTPRAASSTSSSIPFVPAPSPTPSPTPVAEAQKAQVFLCYARQDAEAVGQLYQELSDSGFKPWMDAQDILPGERWEPTIERAIRDSDFFLACLSSSSVSKRGFIQREIKRALEAWEEKLMDDIFLIPVRLEECPVPEVLRSIHWVDLFKEDGFARLLKALQIGLERRGDSEPPTSSGESWLQRHPATNEEPSLVLAQGDARLKIGNHRGTQGDADDALRLYQQALALKEKAGDINSQGTILADMGRVYHAQGDTAQALQFYQQALALKEQVGDVSGQGTILADMGRVYHAQGDTDRALQFYQRALALKEQVGDINGQGIILADMGRLYHAQGDTD